MKAAQIFCKDMEKGMNKAMSNEHVQYICEMHKFSMLLKLERKKLIKFYNQQLASTLNFIMAQFFPVCCNVQAID